jgi:hypothetical protein
MKNFLGAVLFLFIFGVSNSQGQTLYDLNTIQKIEIYFSQSNWDYQMDTAKAGSEGYTFADSVIINGTFYDSVGVKYKGNISYNPSYVKNPLHIALDEFKPQAYEGIEDIKLGNNFSDPSMIREVLAYKILENYMDCPRSNFAQVYINGAYIGLYSNDESITKDFCSNHFYSSSGTFIKCNPIVSPGPTARCNLKYITSDSSSYFNFYEMKSTYGWNDLVNLCDTVTNYPFSLSEIMDIDRAIWMLAFNNALVNLDSYTGAYCQNFYLYKDKTNHYNPIIWDLNMCFGGFSFIGSGTGIGQMTVSQMQQLQIAIHSSDIYWPLINDIMGNAFNKRMYVAHVRTIVNEFFTNNVYESLASQLQSIIDTAVMADTNKFFSYAQFQAGMTGDVTVGSNIVPGISNLMDARVVYLQSTGDFAFTTPSISSVTPDNSAPAYNSTVTITATVINTDTVYLGYRFDKEKKFVRIQMYDDGAHNDGPAGDNVYGTSFILSAVSVQYYIYAQNANTGMFSPERAEHEFYSLNADIPSPGVGDLVINEFLANNISYNQSDYAEYSDWIELYNNTALSQSLFGLYLSDDYLNQTKYQFPDTAVIQPNSYLIVWADEKSNTSTYLHSNFKLSSSGEQLMLSNSFGAILDSVNYGTQTADITTGRCPNGTGAFTTLTAPTFNLTNCVVGVEESDSNNSSVFIYPNPTEGDFNINSKMNSVRNATQVEIYDLLGEKVYSESIINSKATIIHHSLPAGIYIVSINGILYRKLQIIK